jgi:hypothetical protein
MDKEKILAALGLLRETITLRNGVEVIVQEMTRERSVAYAAAVKSGTPAIVSLIMFGCIDESGDLVFSEEDAETLANASPSQAEKIISKVLEFSGITDTEDDAKND